MDIEILPQHLQRGVQHVQNATGRHSSLPILSHLLLETDRGRLKCSATNLELGVQSWIGCKVKTTGKLCVPAKTFSRLVASLKGEKARLTSEKGSLRLRSDVVDAAIKTLSADDFPIIPSIRKTVIGSVSASWLARSFRVMIPFVSSASEVRPEISGIFFSCSRDGSLVFVSTDSFRLMEYRSGKQTIQNSQEYQCIIPTKAAEEFARLFGESPEEELVELVTEDRQLLFRGETSHLITRLVDGTFPNYAPLIPSTTVTRAVVPKHDLEEALRLSGIFTGSIQDVVLSFQPKRQTITVTGRDIDQGKGTVDVRGAVEGEAADTTFNYRYLLDGLAPVETPEVEIGVNDASKPVVIRPTTKKQGLTYVVMPIRR